MRSARFLPIRSPSLGLIVLGLVLLTSPSRSQDAIYYPPRGSWMRELPSKLGMDAAKLQEAVEYALEHENRDNRGELKPWIERSFGDEPYNEVVGPTCVRGEMSGLVVRKGFIVKEWGPIRRPTMTFSVSKTYLSTVVGLAVDRGLIAEVGKPVCELWPQGPFEDERQRGITWDHLLRQTSDWRGTLFGKPAWADRPPRGASIREMKAVPLRKPGEAWEYNDVRVNLLALAALQVWREPLQRVLRREIMNPIGASPSWRWHGYRNSWVEIDGVKVQSVSGGGHWGGGMHVSTLDQARFGYLMLRDGRWKGRQLVSKEWIEAARTPTKANAGYGYMNWFLNTERKGRDGKPRRRYPSASLRAVTFQGAGSNIVFLDPKKDLLVLVRWIQGRAVVPFLEKVLAAMEE